MQYTSFMVCYIVSRSDIVVVFGFEFTTSSTSSSSTFLTANCKQTAGDITYI